MEWLEQEAGKAALARKKIVASWVASAKLKRISTQYDVILERRAERLGLGAKPDKKRQNISQNVFSSLQVKKSLLGDTSQKKGDKDFVSNNFSNLNKRLATSSDEEGSRAKSVGKKNC